MGGRGRSARVKGWQERFTRFHGSGLTAVRFCRQEGVSTAAFYQWRKRLAGNRAKPAAAAEPPKSRAQKKSLANHAQGRSPKGQAATASPKGQPRAKPPKKQTRKPATCPSFRPIRLSPGGTPMAIHLAGGARIDVPMESLDAVRVVLGELLRHDAASPMGDARC